MLVGIRSRDKTAFSGPCLESGREKRFFHRRMQAAGLRSFPVWKFSLYFAGRSADQHANPAAVGADPGRTVGQSPEVFLETVFADLKTAGAIQTIGQLLFTAVAAKFFYAPATPAGSRTLFAGHHFAPPASEASSQSRYPANPFSMPTATISGHS